MGEDGKPVELGRGAMGVTYKAFDVDLRCPVTLKVISERFSAMNRRDFVFCEKPARRRGCVIRTLPRSCTLGRTGEQYFYAMEFVEGETLRESYQALRPA